MNNLTEFIDKLYAWPAQFEIFKKSADFYNQLTGLTLGPWEGFEIDLAIFAFIVTHAVYIYLFFSRQGTKNKMVTTGRFANMTEMRRFYILPTRTGFYASRISLILCVAMVVMALTGAGNLASVLVTSGVVFGFLGLVGTKTDWFDFKLTVKGMKMFPLGRWNGKRIGLSGGSYRNIFGRQLRRQQRQEHVLVMAPTGKGKTTSYFIPGLIEDAESEDSAVVIDIKEDEDLVDIIGPAWNKAGKKVISFNTWKDSFSTIHFNPLFNLAPDLDNVRTFLTLKTITDTIIRVRHEETGKPAGEAFHWIEQEENLIYGMLFAALLKKDEERNLLSVSEALAGGSESVTNYITSAISTTGVVEKSAKQLYLELNSFLNAKDQKQAEEAVKGARKKMEIFRSPFVRRHMIRPELDINMLFKEPCLLVIKAPMNLPESILFASMLTRLVMLKIYETARERKSRNHNIWLYLDEFPSLMLPDITKFVATVRSSGGGVIAAVQAKEDLTTSTKGTLKGNSPESLETNFGTTVILPGCHLQTCERIARSFGETMVMDKSKIQDVFAFFNYRSMKRWTRAPLVTADSLQYMPEGIAMISPNSRRPFLVKVQPYYKIRKYSKKTRPVKAWKPDLSGPFEKITREDNLDNKLEQEMKNLIDPPEDPPMAEIRNTPVHPPQSPGSGFEQARKEHDEFGKNIADDYLANTDKSHHDGKQFI